MTTAVDTRVPAEGAAAAGTRAPKAGRRRRLFAKYAATLVGLVSLVLLINGSVNVWFAYGEARDAAIRLQREKADAAAQRIEEYIAEIEKQIGWTTATQWASAPIEQRRFDYGRLLRQVPGITELIQLDAQGREQLKVSRLSMDVVGSGADYAADPRFTGAQGKKVWFGPVYFRKESEPYMTMAVAHSGRNAGVTVAEVNLKLIWDVITAIKIGKTGHAYVVDDKGRLIAHPDISRVLRNTDVSGLPQVEAARGASAVADPEAIVRNLEGHRVLSASAPIPKLGWLVFVEQPLSEALAPLFTSVLQTGLLLVLGLAVAILAGLLLARRMTGPIRALDAGAARIGAGALGHRIAVHTGDELEELAERFNTMAADLQSSYADLEKKVEDRTAELTEALDQQTATAEVLGVINSSPGDLAPVFDAILEKAHSLCGADHGNLTIFDGEHFRVAATHEMPEQFAEQLRQPFQPYPGGPQERLLAGERLIHIPDQAAREPTNPVTRAAIDAGVRTLLFVPLRRDDALLGYITAHRKEVRPFTDKQIMLLQNFAAQAVIAMENARLITETREALEQQTATAEVLGVINSSPGDLAPVFDAMLEKAHSLCGITYGTLQLYDGERFRAVAVHGYSESLVEPLREGWSPSTNHPIRGLLDGARYVHIRDLAEIDDPAARRVAELGGIRTTLFVALRKDGTLLGMISSGREEIRPFSEKEIALLQNFAAQAVIAMENARLITETREALEQQTATAEVLGVINSSPGDLAPVFDAMLEKAMRLCEADGGYFLRYRDGNHAFAAGRGLQPDFAGFLSRPSQPASGSPAALAAQGAPYIHIADLKDDDFYRSGEPRRRAIVDLGGFRTGLIVPMRRDDLFLGTFNLGRSEVRPFTDKQIALVRNFAAQAVIAMENARLITETREALEQQTATAEVLGVINSSPGDLSPVFDTMLDKAIRLSEATHSHLFTYDGDLFHLAAARGELRYIEWQRQAGPVQPYPSSPLAQIKRGQRIVHVADIREEEVYRALPIFRESADLRGVRSQITVALTKDNILLGAMVVYRQEVRPFTDKQIALLQNFAAQAVIAMENARLITETREALEQQTATAEVLQVINSSPGDLAPVFQSIVEKAHTLCGAVCGSLQLWDGEKFRGVAMRGFSEAMVEQLRAGYDPSDMPCQRIVEGERVVHCVDLAEVDSPVAREGGVKLGGVGTILYVALRKDDVLLGQIVAARQEVRPFSEKEIALVENFATQAVIAMENARLITETREALEQQTATAEVLGVINSSPGDLAPVFDAILEKAHSLCGAAHGSLMTYDGERFRLIAARALPPRFAELLRQPFLPRRLQERLLRGERFVHISDVAAGARNPDDPIPRASDEAGIRTLLMVPLLKDDTLLGYITAHREEVRPFSDKQIALLQNFAAQAVIAMENARLITETREALEQQTATAEVLGVINSSPGNLAPVFDTMLEKAMRLCEAAFGMMVGYDGEQFPTIAIRDLAPWAADLLQKPLPAVASLAELVRGENVIHIPDARETEAYRLGVPARQAFVDLAGARTALWVALRKEEALLGAFIIYRQEVRPFSDKQIALLQNFAAQAVIAMENVRLITELRESLEYQTATSDVLRVVSRSTFDLDTVLQAVVTTAIRLCRADSATIYRNDNGEYRWAAGHMLSPEYERIERNVRIRPGTGTVVGRAALEGATVQILDAWTDPLYEAKDDARVGGVHTMIGVPLLREGAPIGVIGLARRRVEVFSEREIQLVTTFADQAVIAIENARLLSDLQGRTRDLQESLEYQTATSDVLRVISQSGGELEPVLDTLLETGARLCRAEQAVIALRSPQDGRYHYRTSFGYSAAFKELLLRNPVAPGRGSLIGRTALEGQVVHLEDAVTDPEYTWAEALQYGRWRTGLGVPLLRDGSVVGTLALTRTRIERFTEKQIELVKTFADQAVIAMENARLIGELRERTRDLQESLEYQTATSDVLKVISQSTFDLQPVLETLTETAARLCDAEMAFIFRRQGDLYRVSASVGFSPETKALVEANPISPGRGTVAGRTALTASVVHIPDARLDPEYTWGEFIRVAKTPTMLGVPLLREGVPIGVIVLARQRVEPFTEKQISLVSTFADQAVIAIENARLFNELRERTAELGRSVEELKMLSEVGQAVSSTLDLRAVLSTILTSSLGLTWANAGAIFRYSRAERAFRLVEAVGWDAALMRSVGDLRLAETETAMGEAVARRMPVQLADTAQRASNPLRDLAVAAGFRSALIVPLVGPERTLGAIILMRQEAGEFPPETVRLMQTLASQSVLAIQNARMFREIADKSEQLALASQHKSQFLANMSHELRTPLNAILGYAELLVDGIYGVLPERPSGVLERIQNNGRHLLALINDVLDLAKIEAGQLTLILEDYALAEVVRTVVTATEPLATGKGLKFTAALQEDMPKGHGDARRLSQVLLNLVGNAIKFTDQGEVEIRGSADRGQFVLEVRDTGPGIADADQERIFGEFQQIDNSNTRQKGGTGLGLAISKRMVEMQGGTIAVESVLGQGSTFRVTLPVHVDEMMEAA